jgi:ATP-binding cassette, subfamily B, bacterial
VLLDEATSALDIQTEATVQAAIDRQLGDRTVLVVAHRLSTIMRMDRIIVLSAGRIVEQGSHSELLKKGRVYARYWFWQRDGMQVRSSCTGRRSEMPRSPKCNGPISRSLK